MNITEMLELNKVTNPFDFKKWKKKKNSGYGRKKHIDIQCHFGHYVSHPKLERVQNMRKTSQKYL